jgi:glutamyl-tRNA synthetase
MVRVRVAPSPTGYFHIGSARTALMVWLFAKKNNGTFILRIEDTDKERSKKEFDDDIIEGIKALGLDYDEFYRQSERYDIYREYLDKLVTADKAYYCFCTKEDIEAEKVEMEKSGKTPKYGGKCANLSAEEIKRNIDNEKPYVVRLRNPETKISWEDMIRGLIEFDTSSIGDIVIAKNKNEPLYNLTVVIDDMLMNITHVIRGEDHISNTPKQIAIYRAFDADIPLFAHLPLILSSDRSKMSKRHGATALKDYL